MRPIKTRGQVTKAAKSNTEDKRWMGLCSSEKNNHMTRINITVQPSKLWFNYSENIHFCKPFKNFLVFNPLVSFDQQCTISCIKPTLNSCWLAASPHFIKVMNVFSTAGWTKQGFWRHPPGVRKLVLHFLLHDIIFIVKIHSKYMMTW